MKMIQVTRNIFTNKSTIGDLFFDGEYISNTLEDTIRNVKIAKETAIPAGEYKIEIRHSTKFNRMMPFLCEVPFFEGIMIHWGNDAEASYGCILVGTKEESKADWVSSSRKAFEHLYSLIMEATNRGEEVRINIYGGLRKEDFIVHKQAATVAKLDLDVLGDGKQA